MVPSVFVFLSDSVVRERKVLQLRKARFDSDRCPEYQSDYSEHDRRGDNVTFDDKENQSIDENSGHKEHSQH